MSTLLLQPVAARKDGPNAIAWAKIEDALSISERIRENGHMVVPMEQIKKFGNREIRLLMKQDRRSQVPSFLSGGGTLSVSNSEVLFYEKDLHVDLPIPKVKQQMFLKESDLPPLVNPWMITSEPQAISVAENLGLFEEFLGEKPMSIPTGRHRLHSPIKMKLHSKGGGVKMIDINNPQIEADAWEIRSDVVHVVEAKHGNASELHSRQLFYPFHDMKSRLEEEGRTHSVSPLVLNSKATGIFDFYQFEFTDPQDILTSKLSEAMSFELIREDPFTDLVEPSSNKPNYEAPFPQADDLGLVLRTVKLLSNGGDRFEWEFETGYEPRQFDYYFNAAKWIGLTQGSPSNPTVTDIGDWVIRSRPEDHRKKIAQILANDWAFSTGMRTEVEELVGAIKEEILVHPAEYRVNTEITAYRRAQTVRGWLLALGIHQ